MNNGIHVMNPPAIIREAFDEQSLKREWDEATADEQDALARKAEVLHKALKQWPMVPNPRFAGRMMYSPEMRRFVRDVLGMPDDHKGSMNSFAGQLLKHGPEKQREACRQATRRTNNIKRAAVELATKYRLGADPRVCMEALANMIEGKLP